ncbi:MAG TPA: cohesin domain-containing protein [Candidatus Acidoferrales bacterium]|nr:cohesin domain-containing protein [Candidatus Acidoferrales bacterium]
MQNRSMLLLALVCSLPALSGCPKGNVDAKAGNQAEAIQDYDTALMHYERALKSDPTNSEFRLKETRIRFEDGQYHVQQGQKARQRGDLQTALAEFQRAAATDPSSPIAAEELQRTAQMIAEANATNAANNPPPAPAEGELLAAAPQLAPLKGPLPPIHMTNNPRTLYETIAQIAGITVVFDPAWQPQNKSIRVDLPTASLADALNIVALESHSFWTPVSDKIVMVAEENAAKRKEFENEVVKFFYLSSPLADTDLTDIVNAIRQTMGATNISHIQPVKSINAIVMRETPDKIAVAQRIINAIDKAKPEVVVDVKVLTANRDLVRNLGINPGGTATVTFAPPGTTSTTSGSGTGTGTGSSAASTATLTLQQLKHLSSADYSVSLPSATINALFTDNRTQMIQEPQVRSIDGEKATVNIGSRVPIATGSFQAGTGVGVASAASLVSPLVNTQFQYQNVGVNVDVTPHIHPNNDITLKLRVEISAVASTQNLGGIQQPVFSQNVIDHTVDLKDGEVSILGGFIQKQDTNNISGWPGLAKIPILRYIFSSEDVEHQENELLLVLIPHIVRVPVITPADMQTFASGTDTNIQVRPLLPVSPAVANASAAQLPPAMTPNAAVQPMTGGQSSLHFEPAVASLKVGQTMALGITVQGVNDLFSIPMLLQYDPKVISIEEVRDGGFFNNNDPTQIGAIVQRIDQEHGQAVISATRMPNTPGVSGTGTLVGIMVKGLAPGDAKISIVQVNAHDSQQRPITLATNEATVHVQQ